MIFTLFQCTYILLAKIYSANTSLTSLKSTANFIYLKLVIRLSLNTEVIIM